MGFNCRPQIGRVEKSPAADLDSYQLSSRNHIPQCTLTHAQTPARLLIAQQQLGDQAVARRQVGAGMFLLRLRLRVHSRYLRRTRPLIPAHRALDILRPSPSVAESRSRSSLAHRQVVCRLLVGQEPLPGFGALSLSHGYLGTLHGDLMDFDVLSFPTAAKKAGCRRRSSTLVAKSLTVPPATSGISPCIRDIRSSTVDGLQSTQSVRPGASQTIRRSVVGARGGAAGTAPNPEIRRLVAVASGRLSTAPGPRPTV